MTTFLADVRNMLAPRASGAHGPLAPILVSMTVVTGLVDAFSYLVLGHVFVANMTGNVVILGFALAGAPGFSIAASVIAIVAFGVGALVGGRLVARHSDHRGRLHSSAAGIESVFLLASVLLAASSARPEEGACRYALIAALGISMGVQNAAVRKIAIPDLTTTVVTLTFTGIAADSTLAGGSGSRAGRRTIPIVCMLAGAFVGAVLVLHTEVYYPLVIALVATVVGAVTTYRLGKPDPDWVRDPAAGLGGKHPPGKQRQ
jgi:uncharacterized membrane protein YoaK (UPF0700 family)